VLTINAVGTFSTLRSFGAADPPYPIGSMAQGGDGNIYGTTSGLDNSPIGGSVFRITPAGALTVLHTFVDRMERINATQSQFFPGGRIVSGLTRISDGSFIGTTCCEAPRGRVFRITTSGAVFRMLTVEGREMPSAPIQASDGNFYGTQVNIQIPGPANGVYKLTPSGQYSFVADLDAAGAYPVGGLVEGPAGAFYGTTSALGTYSRGALFRVVVP
jgi:uncharacterized repeat protein (TIGR03803 family)